MLYLSDFSGNRVAVVDTGAGAVSASIPLGASVSEPHGVAVSEDGTRAFIANSGSNNIAVIDTQTDTVMGLVGVGDTPYGIVFNPTDNRFYVANSGGNTITIIDPETRMAVGSIAVGRGPHGIGIKPDGSRLYVGNWDDGTVSVIDATIPMTIGSVPVGVGPHGVAVSPSGQFVYVANVWSDTLSVIDTATTRVVKTITVGKYPYVPRFSPDGIKAYVSNYGSGTVSVVDTASHAVTGTISVGTGPHGIDIDPATGRIYVVNEISADVSVVDAATGTVVSTIPVGGQPIAFGRFLVQGAPSDAEAHTLWMDGVPGWAVPGNLLDWNLGIVPGSQGGKFDLYAALFLPDGTPIFFTPYGLESIIIPYGIGLTVSEAKFSLFQPFPLPAALPHGSYIFAGVLVEHGANLAETERWASNVAFQVMDFGSLSADQQAFVDALGYPQRFIKTFSTDDGVPRVDESWIYAGENLLESFVNGMFVNEVERDLSCIAPAAPLHRPEEFQLGASMADIKALLGEPLETAASPPGTSEFFAEFQADTYLSYDSVVVGFAGNALVSVITEK
jgi:YVTN family beta-propeller protein